MKKILLLSLYILSMCVVLAQDDSLNVNGTLIYYGDQLIFYPGYKHKGNKRTIKKISQIDGIALKAFNVSFTDEFDKIFDVIETDSSGFWTLSEYRDIFISEVTIRFNSEKFNSKSIKTGLKSGFFLKKKYYEFSATNVLSNGVFISSKRKYKDSYECKEELRITPPGTFVWR